MSDYVRSRRPPELTTRQVEVLEHVAAGMTNAAIARRLGITEESVKRHLRELRMKLSARDRAHAVHLGWQRGYLGGVPTSKRARRPTLVSDVRDRVR